MGRSPSLVFTSSRKELRRAPASTPSSPSKVTLMGFCGVKLGFIIVSSISSIALSRSTVMFILLSSSKHAFSLSSIAGSDSPLKTKFFDTFFDTLLKYVWQPHQHVHYQSINITVPSFAHIIVTYMYFYPFLIGKWFLSSIFIFTSFGEGGFKTFPILTPVYFASCYDVIINS